MGDRHWPLWLANGCAHSGGHVHTATTAVVVRWPRGMFSAFLPPPTFSLPGWPASLECDRYIF